MSNPVYESKIKAPTKFSKSDSFTGGSKMTERAINKNSVGLSPVCYTSNPHINT